MRLAYTHFQPHLSIDGLVEMLRSDAAFGPRGSGATTDPCSRSAMADSVRQVVGLRDQPRRT